MNASFCSNCKDKSCLKTGKPCKPVERYLKKQGIFSRNWIRPRVSDKKALRDGLGKWREIPFSMLTKDIPLDCNDVIADKTSVRRNI